MRDEQERRGDTTPTFPKRRGDTTPTFSERRGDTTPTFDEPPFFYSIARPAASDHIKAEFFALGAHDEVVVSLIRAAIESRTSLPPGLFESPEQRMLIDFLCGDPIDEELNKQDKRNVFMSVCLRRGTNNSNSPTAWIRLAGRSLRAFEALLYLARLRLAEPGYLDRLDGALLFCLGFSMDHIERNMIPF